jgi:hypothetical protein
MVKLPVSGCASGGFQGVRPWAAAFAGLALTACATTSEPRVVTKEVRVPVPVKCATVAPPDPSYSDSPSALKAAADVFEQAKLLLAGRKQRDARIVELKAAVAGCT